MSLHTANPSIHEDQVEEAARQNKQFVIMAVLFGINHAAVTTPIIYASSYLESDIGNASNSMLYGACVLSSLFAASYTNIKLGPRLGLFMGMILYVIYAGCFTVGITVCKVKGANNACDRGGGLQWMVASFGGVVGGLGAGVLWTSQGALFARYCETIARLLNEEKSVVSTRLGSVFASLFVGSEAITKCLFSVLDILKVDMFRVFLAATVLALCASILWLVFSHEDLHASSSKLGVCDKFMAAVALWPDPKLWLISGINFSFGLSVGWLNGYVNANYQKEAFGDSGFIGFTGALVALIATISAMFYGRVSTSMGKICLVLLGSVCFFGVGALSKVHIGGKGPGSWGWGVLSFYVLQGMGRGVFESTNRTIFADMFPGEKSTGAFANCMMQGTLSSAVAFLMNSQNVTSPLIYLLVAFSVLTTPAYCAAYFMHRTGTLIGGRTWTYGAMEKRDAKDIGQTT